VKLNENYVLDKLPWCKKMKIVIVFCLPSDVSCSELLDSFKRVLLSEISVSGISEKRKKFNYYQQTRMTVIKEATFSIHQISGSYCKKKRNYGFNNFNFKENF
jgi:hypothetical protein